jgi:hypothetical protein
MTEPSWSRRSAASESADIGFEGRGISNVTAGIDSLHTDGCATAATAPSVALTPFELEVSERMQEGPREGGWIALQCRENLWRATIKTLKIMSTASTIRRIALANRNCFSPCLGASSRLVPCSTTEDTSATGGAQSANARQTAANAANAESCSLLCSPLDRRPDPRGTGVLYKALRLDHASTATLLTSRSPRGSTVHKRAVVRAMPH